MNRKTIIIIYFVGFILLAVLSYYMQKLYGIDIHAAFIYIIILLMSVVISLFRTSHSILSKIAVLLLVLYITIVKGIIEFFGYIGNIRDIDLWSTRAILALAIIFFIVSLFKKKEEVYYGGQ